MNRGLNLLLIMSILTTGVSCAEWHEYNGGMSDDQALVVALESSELEPSALEPSALDYNNNLSDEEALELAIERSQPQRRQRRRRQHGGRRRPQAIALETSCAICMEDYTDCTRLKVLPCGHSFCTGCIGRWLQEKNECSTCRQPVNGRIVSGSYADLRPGNEQEERQAEQNRARVAQRNNERSRRRRQARDRAEAATYQMVYEQGEQDEELDGEDEQERESFLSKVTPKWVKKLVPGWVKNLHVQLRLRRNLFTLDKATLESITGEPCAKFSQHVKQRFRLLFLANDSIERMLDES